MWEDTYPAPAPASSGSSTQDLLNGIFGLASKKLDQETLKGQTQQTFNGGSTTPRYGVAEGGVPFVAGNPSFTGGQFFGVPAPLVLVGVGILALAFILHGKH